MDPRKYQSGASASPPAPLASPSDGYPRSGDPGTGTPATVPGPYWHHAIAEEMLNVILGAGLTPDYEDLTQFSQALATLVAPKASQSEVNAETNDSKFVTPLTLGPKIRSLTIGDGQSYQDVLASRTSGVTYTNTTGRTIAVFISNPSTTAQVTLTATVDGQIVGNVADGTTGNNRRMNLYFLVPHGATYVVTSSGITVSNWVELR